MDSISPLLRRVGRPALLLALADCLIALGVPLLVVSLKPGVELVSIAGIRAIGVAGPALAFAGCALLGLLSMGLYRARQRATRLETVVRVMIAGVLTLLGCTVLYVLWPALTLAPGILLPALLATGVGAYWGRQWLLPAIDQAGGKRRIVVLGLGKAARRIAGLRRKSDQRRFKIVGYIAEPGAGPQRVGQRRLGPLLSLDLEALRAQQVDEIVVAVDDRRGGLPVESLLRLKLAGVPVTDVITFLERETGRIELDLLHPAWLLFQHSRHTEIAYGLVKRCFDVLLGLFLLLLMSPVLLLAALAIAMESGWQAPVLYRQERVGLQGRIFRLLKFRSMRPDAEIDGKARWAADRDGRVTRVGHWLRRFRIDELPQIWNIIRGDMSLVGPRPERPEFVRELSARIPLYYYRLSMRPGLGGWAQLNFPYGASADDARVKLNYDLYYIKNANIVLDLLILLQTAEVVCFGRGTAMAGRHPGPGARPAAGIATRTLPPGSPPPGGRQLPDESADRRNAL